MKIIDCDGHLYERRDLWVDYSDARDRELALRIVDDELGYPWLTYKGRTTDSCLCYITDPGDQEFVAIREPKIRHRQGEPANWSYEDVPLAYWNPTARRDRLDGWGIDEAVLFPHWGLEWERIFFTDDLEGHRVNMAAWNRWAVEVAQEGRGRLHPVGHISLQGELAWARAQLDTLSKGGIRLACFTPGLVNRKRLSHPDVDPIWDTFIDHGMTVAFHIIIGVPSALDAAWTQNDHDAVHALWVPFSHLDVQIALADMAVNGVFQRHPELRVAVVEQNAAHWAGTFLPAIDAGYDSNKRYSGWSVNPSLEMLPSEYILKHCRFTAFANSDPLGVAKRLGDVFAFGGDYPHCEGYADPLRDYEAVGGTAVDGGEAARLLYEGNASWLLQSS